VIDGVDDRRRLLDVGEPAGGASGLHDQQPCLGRNAGDSLCVRSRSGGERRDEGAVAVEVGDVTAVRADAVGERRLRRDVRRVQVGPGVDHRDRYTRRRPGHLCGNEVGVNGGVLPLERHA
jgi:hypothetical protein